VSKFVTFAERLEDKSVFAAAGEKVWLESFFRPLALPLNPD